MPPAIKTPPLDDHVARAAAAGDLDLIKKFILQDGIDIAGKPDILHWAAVFTRPCWYQEGYDVSRHVAMIQYLIEQGANVRGVMKERVYDEDGDETEEVRDRGTVLDEILMPGNDSWRAAERRQALSPIVDVIVKELERIKEKPKGWWPEGWPTPFSK